MKIDPPHDLKPRTNLGETTNENSLRDGLIKLVYKFAKSVAQTSSKVQNPTPTMRY